VILDFDPAALAELEQAAEWYDAQRHELRREFLAEVLAGLDRIRELPKAWQLLGRSVRRFRLSRFPYGIVYQVHDDRILIVAIAHLHRKPGYWKRRLTKGR
jgi:plasmid stabilization system protein ParE